MADPVAHTLERALAAHARADNAAGLALCRQLLPLAPHRADAWNLQGALLRQAGEVERACASFRVACGLAPGNAEPFANLGNCLKQLGRWPDAVPSYRTAVSLRPDWMEAWVELSDALRLCGRAAEAVEAGRRALALAPDRARALDALASALLATGDSAAACAHYRRAAAAAPDDARILCNLAQALHRDGDLAGARAAWEHALGADARQAGAAFGLGVLAQQEGDTAGARKRYEQALAADPQHLGAAMNLAGLLCATGEPAAAAALYGHCLARDPEHAGARYGQALAQHLAGDLDAAERGYRACLERKPDHAEAAYHLGNLCVARNDGAGALLWFQRTTEIDPANLAAEAMVVRARLETCDWSVLDRARRLLERLLDPQVSGTAPSPFGFLAYPVDLDEAQLLVLARRRAAQIAAPIAPLPQRARTARDRLRLGYVSSDFYNHATAHLMRGLFRRHDRSRLAVYAYSFGPDDGSDYRRGIAADCDHFIDVAGQGAGAIAGRIAADGIDILVDLKGYTRDCRTEIFAYRPAPLQVQYLGYPGSMGADFIDAVLTDRVVTPPSQQPCYTERLAYLPHSYQVNDDGQAIAPQRPTRAQCGLPERGFVFCCFCAHYKIEPAIFARWMDLLRQVPGAVLWLQAGSTQAMDRLRQAAAGHGVDAARLVFAPVVAKEHHLARLAHADLFLDTHYYNAHTTASDALWAGVPVLSTPGRTFASRVGASLLHALDLPQLVATDLDGYTAQALELAHDPRQLGEVRETLARHRLTRPLFDTDAFARDLDALLFELWSTL